MTGATAPAGWADAWKAAFRTACAGVSGLDALSDGDVEKLVLNDRMRLEWDPNARPLDERLPRRIALRAGERLLYAGARDNAAFCLVEGSARITDSAAQVDEILVGERTVGDWIGEQAALINIPRSADAVMSTDGVVLKVPAPTFRLLHRRKLRSQLALRAGFEASAIEITIDHQSELRLLDSSSRRRLAAVARMVVVD